MYAVSAIGFYVPPMLIYPRARMKESLSYGAHPGTVSHCQDKICMDSELFFEWKCHFISAVKPLPQ
jgi:hypothetical protein